MEAGGRNFEIGSDAKPLKEFCLLLAHLVFLKHLAITGLRGLSVPHSTGPSKLIISQEKAPETCPQASRIEALSQLSARLPNKGN